MLFNKNNNNVSMPPEAEVPKFPVFPNIVSVENDASQAKVLARICRTHLLITGAFVKYLIRHVNVFTFLRL